MVELHGESFLKTSPTTRNPTTIMLYGKLASGVNELQARRRRIPIYQHLESMSRPHFKRSQRRRQRS